MKRPYFKIRATVMKVRLIRICEGVEIYVLNRTSAKLFVVSSNVLFVVSSSVLLAHRCNLSSTKQFYHSLQLYWKFFVIFNLKSNLIFECIAIQVNLYSILSRKFLVKLQKDAVR